VKLRRGIFTKLVLVFLLVGLVPFLAMGVWTYFQAKTPMTEAVIESWLVRLARETAAHVDLTLSGLRTSVLVWSEERRLTTRSTETAPQEWLASGLARRAMRLGDVALVMVVEPGGRIVAAARPDPSKPVGALIGRSIREVAPSPSQREWIERALASRAQPVWGVGWHRSPFLLALDGPATRPAEGHEAEGPDAYQIGYSAPLGRDPAAAPEAALAVVFRFETVQRVLDQVERKFRDRPVRYPSGYAFLFDDDGDTVIGHKKRELYGTSLTRHHGLPELHEAVMSREFGFQHYEFPKGTGKISGFARTETPAMGGFGWTVGVGIDHSDIYADVTALRGLLAVASLVVAGLVVLMAALLSARITRPLTKLVGFTESVARGNLDARVSIRTNDEIAVLANAFNRMTSDLKETNHRLIQAEKDAAWREMARQVAHEIKNPLTPVMLSAQQIERALADRHPELDAIVRDSVKSIVEQCESLRQIAQNFASYAAFPKPHLERIGLAELLDKVVSVYAAHQREGFRVVTAPGTPEGYAVRADVDAMRRVFLNLFNNAFEAMSGTGTITVSAQVRKGPAGDVALISVADTGRGIQTQDLPHLFEPYFSTRSGGTGLGLAICRKIVTEHEGSISVESETGKGTTFTISLPCFPADSPPTGADDDSFSETRTLPRSR
jgi:signal transduction histidine kinase